MAVYGFGSSYLIDQALDQWACLRIGHSLDLFDVGSDKNIPVSRHRILAYQTLAHRMHVGTLTLGYRIFSDLGARINIVMDPDF